MKKANVSHAEYTNDSFLFKPDTGKTMQAVDMQKVMLPRMPGIKRAVLNRRIVAFNGHLWACGVVVSMFDFHRSDRGSNPGRGSEFS